VGEPGAAFGRPSQVRRQHRCARFAVTCVVTTWHGLSRPVRRPLPEKVLTVSCRPDLKEEQPAAFVCGGFRSISCLLYCDPVTARSNRLLRFFAPAPTRWLARGGSPTGVVGCCQPRRYTRPRPGPCDRPGRAAARAASVGDDPRLCAPRIPAHEHHAAAEATEAGPPLRSSLCAESLPCGDS
jgi:hypothetical protein